MKKVPPLAKFLGGKARPAAPMPWQHMKAIAQMWAGAGQPKPPAR